LLIVVWAAALATSCADGRVNVPIDLGIANYTELTVTLVVNDRVIGEYEPGEYDDALVPPRLPDPPWHAEARTSTGRVLLSLDVAYGDVWYTAPDANGHSVGEGRAALLYLSCGRLDLYAVSSLGGPAPPGSFPPGDCVP
jgi:hypothetical protein